MSTDIRLIQNLLSKNEFLLNQEHTVRWKGLKFRIGHMFSNKYLKSHLEQNGEMLSLPKYFSNCVNDLL